MRTQHDTLHWLARPSFFEGMARVLDVGRTLQKDNDSPTVQDADYRAMLSDWAVTGDDLSISIEAYGHRIGQSPTR